MAKNTSRREENLDKIRKLGEQVRVGGALTHAIDVDFESASGTEYVGTVVVRRPTMQDYIKIGVEKGRIIQKFGMMLDDNGNVHFVAPEYIDSRTLALAHMMATLNAVCAQVPPWLANLDEVEDYDVIDHVYRRYDEWVGNFRKDSARESGGNS